MLRQFSSNFFLVTCFLPARERAEVEVIYAAVRFPDEIADTFPLEPSQRLAMLAEWEAAYLQASQYEGIRARVAAGALWILASFAEIVWHRGIPREHYLSFLAAMRRDVHPTPFASLAQLTEEYVYGSAVVVGYFLTHVYRHAPHATLADALRCARQLGIALQLTNFARDVFEDHLRGRLYLPVDILAAEGLTDRNYMLAENQKALRRALQRLARHAEDGYEYAPRNLVVFTPGCRPALAACIDVYRRLNQRILGGDGPLKHRISLSAAEKFRMLPSEKYWRVLLAYAGLL